MSGGIREVILEVGVLVRPTKASPVKHLMVHYSVDPLLEDFTDTVFIYVSSRVRTSKHDVWVGGREDTRNERRRGPPGRTWERRLTGQSVDKEDEKNHLLFLLEGISPLVEFIVSLLRSHFLVSRDTC